MPTRMRLVLVAMELAMVIGEDKTDRSGLKCNSASQAPSRPHSSAASTSLKPSLKAST